MNLPMLPQVSRRCAASLLLLFQPCFAVDAARHVRCMSTESRRIFISRLGRHHTILLLSPVEKGRVLVAQALNATLSCVSALNPRLAALISTKISSGLKGCRQKPGSMSCTSFQQEVSTRHICHDKGLRSCSDLAGGLENTKCRRAPNFLVIRRQRCYRRSARRAFGCPGPSDGYTHSPLRSAGPARLTEPLMSPRLPWTLFSPCCREATVPAEPRI
jgi:hypothetical protein